MAIETTTQTLNDGPRNLVMQLTGICDGSGNENKVVKVDVSALTPPCDEVKVSKMSGVVDFGVVELYWEALTDVMFAVLSGQFEYCYDKPGGLLNNAGGGKTGDLLLSTAAFELNSTYSILIEMVKKYAA